MGGLHLVSYFMPAAVASVGELPEAVPALERLFSTVGAGVGREMVALLKPFIADGALEPTLLGVDSTVADEVAAPSKEFVANRACEWHLFIVPGASPHRLLC